MWGGLGQYTMLECSEIRCCISQLSTLIYFKVRPIFLGIQHIPFKGAYLSTSAYIVPPDFLLTVFVDKSVAGCPYCSFLNYS